MAHEIVIVGGGFGGLYAARALAHEKSVHVTLVDRQNYHLFQPLLYQVATAGLSPSDIASPIRGLVSAQANTNVRLGEVQRIDLGRKQVHLHDVSLPYDSLVLAAGVRHSYFGHREWEAYAPGLKSLDDALELRRRVLLAFEEAEDESSSQRRDALMTFVVVGGGPTGVELAGALAELSRFTVRRDFRRIDPLQAKVVLIEAGPRVLASFSARLSGKALASLRRLGVDVRLDTKVLDVSASGVTLHEGFLPARTVLWAAGVEAPALTKTLGVPLDRAGRVLVKDDLTIDGHPEAYVIGDLASFALPQGGTLPGLAPVAMQQGRHAARNIMATIAQKPRLPFHYFDKGTMATVGRASGIAQAGRIEVWGFLGWLAWLFIHLIFLIGFRNRALVLLQWAWAWFTYQRGARLITGLTAPPTVVPTPPHVDVEQVK